MKTEFLKIAALALATACAAAPQMSNRLSDIEDAQGFEILFDGTYKSFNENFVNYKRLDSTNVALPPDWKVDEAQGIVTTEGAANTDIRSVGKYADFDLRFDYRNDGDAGALYRFNLNDPSPWYTGVEYAIIDDQDNCKTCAGAVLDLYPPVPLIYRPYSTKHWNHARIVAIKDSVEHWLNGEKMAAYKVHSADFWTRFDASRWAATSLTFKTPGSRWGGYIETGYVGFQSLKSHWQMRNIRINKTKPGLGADKWWASTTAIPNQNTTSVKSAATMKSRGDRASIDGALIYRASGNAFNADGRTAR